ncbi:MAG: lipopolysaccharide heptosyltransferase II [Candidatus Omnitrophota bacterium]
MRSDKPERILIVRLDRIGDVVLSTPAIRAVKRAFPESRLSVMVRPPCVDIVRGSPFVDTVITYDKDGPEKGIAPAFRMIKKLRREKFDIAIVLHPTTRSHLAVFMAGIPVRVGYDRKLGWLLTKKVKHEKHLGKKHEIDYALDLVRTIGCDDPDRSLFMPTNEENANTVDAIFKESGIQGKYPVVVIHPAASCPSKQWPADRFAEVAGALKEEFRADIVIIGGLRERKVGEDLANSIKGDAVNLTGKTSIGELASVFRRSRLLISCDSGPVHVASAVGVPVVAIFGRSDKGLSPKRWGPTGGDDAILHKFIGCEACLAHNCKKEFMCLKAVSVEEVLSSSRKILSGALS